MSIRPFSLVLAVGLVASGTFGQQSDPELAKGIRLVEQGEYSQAIIVLDTASRRLDRRPQDKGLAAQAYLHLGIAYVAEGQENLARGAFRDALTRQPGLSLSAFDVSPKVREVFQQVKNEIAQQKPSAKKGGSKAPLIILGVAAAGGGVALAASGAGSGSRGPGFGPITVSAGCQVEGCPILLGNSVNFITQSGSPVTWDFGDGGTGTGNSFQRFYTREGTFTVVATSGSETARTTVTVRGVAGTWDGTGGFVVRLAQNGQTLSGDVDGAPLTGLTTNCLVPRCMRIDTLPSCSSGAGGPFIGSVNDAVTAITGTGSLPCMRASTAQTLTRRQ